MTTQIALAALNVLQVLGLALIAALSHQANASATAANEKLDQLNGKEKP